MHQPLKDGIKNPRRQKTWRMAASRARGPARDRALLLQKDGHGCKNARMHLGNLDDKHDGRPLPRFLYLHGFASGPDSKKGVHLAQHFAERGVDLLRLNLRLPSFAHLRASAMVDAVKAAIGSSADRAVLFGSSLGGYIAAHVAAEDPRVAALVLLAPAFNLLKRWRARLGESGFRLWQETGFWETLDHTTGKPAQVDFGFYEDLQKLDGAEKDVRVPTLIVHGRGDDAVDISSSRAFASGRPHVRLVEVDDGHDLVASLPRIKLEADAFLQPFLGEPKTELRSAYSVAVYPRRGDRLLLIRHRRLGVWLPPGGECLPGESPLAAAARELHEETGLLGEFPVTSDIDGTPPGLIGYEEHQAGKKGQHRNFVFVADVKTDEISPNDEFHEWRWVTLEDGPWADAPRNVLQLARVALAARRTATR